MMRATDECCKTRTKTKFFKQLTLYSQSLISFTTTKSTKVNWAFNKTETLPSTTHSQLNLPNLWPSLIKTMMALSTAKSFSLYSAKLPMAIASFQMVSLMRKTAKPVGLNNGNEKCCDPDKVW